MQVPKFLAYQGSILPFLAPLSYPLVSPFLDSLQEECVSFRSGDQIYGVLQADYLFVVGCLRRMNPIRMRLCGAWVAPLVRGRGWGEECLRYRLAHIPADIQVIDTFAFRARLYLSLGFVAGRQYKIGTTYLRKVQ
jgi:hypothetical protein